ncbi:MAG: hypothetical protein EPO68_08890 [Planctomycetota bacterium]|nr:MAG: hypothetical protein EPO68_08890 [Planctomycetota bacterium]
MLAVLSMPLLITVARDCGDDLTPLTADWWQICTLIGLWNLWSVLPLLVTWLVALNSDSRPYWWAARAVGAFVVLTVLLTNWQDLVGAQGDALWPLSAVMALPIELGVAALALGTAWLVERIKLRTESVDTRPFPHAPHRRRPRPLP